MTELVRMYKYRAFPPEQGRDAFFTAVALKREMWSALCEMQAECGPAITAAAKAKDKDRLSELRQRRTARVADIRRDFAARGLSWGDYNAVIFQFDGACRASAARGAMPQARDHALGEAVVRQLQGHVLAPHLVSRRDVRLEYQSARPGQHPRTSGSRRASVHRRAAIDFQLRTDRSPTGPATLSLDLVLHRPLPAAARVVEVRVIRTMRPIIRKDGSAGEVERWHVCFACRVEARSHAGAAIAGAAIAGVMPSWAADGDGGVNALMVAHDDFGARRITFDEAHLERWARARQMFEAADRIEDDADRAAALARANIHRRRIERERLDRHRQIARDLARRYHVIAIPDIWLGGKGAKAWTAPAQLLRELRHAVENEGGSIIAVKLDDQAVTPKMRAQQLRRAAVADIFDTQDHEIDEAAE